MLWWRSGSYGMLPRRCLMPTEKQAPHWRAQFLEYLTAERGYSGHTISAYESDLEQFSLFLGKDLLSASTDDIRKFTLRYLEDGRSPMSARRKLSALKGFYHFVFAEDGLAADPSRNIRAPKAFRSIIRPITRHEVDQILTALGTDRLLDLRNRALIYAVYGSGLRVSEVAALPIADLDFRHSYAKVRLGKGQKDRRVPLNKWEMEALSLYLDKARPRFAQEPDNGVLFISRRGEPLTRQRLWQILTE